MNAPSNATSPWGYQNEPYPLLWASFALSAGIVFGHYAWRPPLWWLVAWLVFALSAAYLLHQPSTAAFALATATLFILGALVVELSPPSNLGDPSIYQFTDGRDLLITAHVIAEGIIR